MRISRYFGRRSKSQEDRSPPKVANPWQLAERFLVFGTEDGAYQVKARFSVETSQNIIGLIKTEGLTVVDRIVEVAKSGRAPQTNAPLYALALASSFGDTETRRAAFAALPTVCRTGSQLLQFVAEAEQLRGWGRGMRKAIADWYVNTDADELTHQALRYQNQGGWSHRDLLRLSHPKPPTEEHRVLFKWIVDETLAGPNPRIEAVQRLSESGAPVADLIREHRLTRDNVPAQLLNDPNVWEALLEDMTVSVMIQNLANMTRCGLLTEDSSATQQVVEKLTNETLLRRTRLHPLALLLAHATYDRSCSPRDTDANAPVDRILRALDSAFYSALGGLEPTGCRTLVCLDVSGSMSTSTVAGTPLTACEASTALALASLWSDIDSQPMAFADNLRSLPIKKKMTLADALKHTRNVNFGGVDCALPYQWALRNRVEVDAFVTYSDADTSFGKVHPTRALDEYRQKTGINAKCLTVGMCSDGFKIADSQDLGMLDVIGFDATVPHAIREFLDNETGPTL